MPSNKTLLVQPNYQQKKDAAAYGKIPPLGLAYIAAMLEKEGFEVEILDANVLNLSPQQVADYAIEKKADIVGLSILTPVHNYCIQVAKLLPDRVTSIAGGPHASGLPEEFLKDGFDLVVRGEGEFTMLDLVKGKNVKDIPGVSYIKDDKMIHNVDRPPIDPNVLPLPARHLLINNGVDKPYFSEGTRYFPWSPIFSARGCPYSCNYCNKLTFGKCFSPRTPEKVIEEIIELVSKYKIKQLDFHDDCFNFDIDRAEKILDLIIAEKLNLYIRFSNGLRADKITENLLVKMKKAGCGYIAYGVESGCQDILNKIPKGIKLETIEKAVKLTKKHGITTVGFFMFGLLGDNEQTMQKTIDFSKKLDLDAALFSITVPYPGTMMWQLVKEKGRILLSSWDEFFNTSGKMVYEYPGTASPMIVEKMYKKAIREFYFRPKYILKQLPRLFNLSTIPVIMKGVRKILFSQS